MAAQRLVEEPLDVGFARDVADDEVHAARARSGGALEVLARAPEADDVGPVAREAERERASDARAGPGDHDRLAREDHRDSAARGEASRVSCASIASATRRAFAAIVRLGFVPLLDGKNEASTT